MKNCNEKTENAFKAKKNLKSLLSKSNSGNMLTGQKMILFYYCRRAPDYLSIIFQMRSFSGPSSINAIQALAIDIYNSVYISNPEASASSLSSISSSGLVVSFIQK
jgi:hypothetical protein